MTILHRACLLILLGAMFVGPASADCTPLSGDTRLRITNYLAQRITPASGRVAILSIISESTLGDTCYKKLVVQVSGTFAPLTFYLSPDQRFLSSTLYDMTKDPTIEASEIAANVARLLDRDPSPRLLHSNARVTVVEFADMQCPYCRSFDQWYDGLPSPLRESTSLVFKHLPLPQHSWARIAAESSACVNQQSSASFWSLLNYLFAHQEQITPDNIKETILAVLTRASDIDTKRLALCEMQGVGAKLVDRDLAIAKELFVTSTPTLFINGRRLPVLHSRDDLERVLNEELNNNSVKDRTKALTLK